MPAAVGVALAAPGRRVAAIIGDGSAMYSIQSMFSAFQLGARVTFLILNNGSYEALKGFGRIFGMQQVPGTDLGGLDFVALARGHGIGSARRVDTADELDIALAESFAAEGPNLIEIIIQ